MIHSIHLLPESTRKNLVLILDGVDKFDLSSDTFYFLRLSTPKTIKLIYSCNRDTEIYKFFKTNFVTEINAELPDPTNKFALTLYYSKTFSDFPVKIFKDLKKFGITQNAFYLKFLYNCLSKSSDKVPKIEIKSLDSFRTVQSLFEYCLEVFSNRHKKIYKLFAYLALASSGLSDIEITNLTGNLIHPYLKFFEFIIYKNSNRSCLSNTCLKALVLQKYCQCHSKLNSKVASVLEKFNSELISDIAFSMFKSKDWMRLKNYLSKIPVFSYLFKKEFKLDLFKYWVCLQNQKMDPVDCYNKSIESFSNINQLSPQDLSILLIQFTIFFKEISEVEDENQVKFRHPLLSGSFELKEIDLLDEFKRLGDLILCSAPEEVPYAENEITREKIKEKVINRLKLKLKDRKTKKLYNLKRWLWIQFPWCSLDVHSNFSQILQVLESQPEKHEKEFVDSIDRIIRNSGLVYSDFKFRTIDSKFTTTASTVSLRPLSRQKKVLRPSESQSAIIGTSFIEKHRIKTSSIFKSPQNLSSMSFTGIKPENALEYVQNNFIKFSSTKILKRNKETLDLQKIYNQKVQEYRLKKSKLEAISSQIDYSNTEIMAQEQAMNKVLVLQEKLKDMCKKINKTEAEGSRYKEIIGICFKNPAKNDECERTLNLKIESMKKIIDIEKKNIEIFESEANDLKLQHEEFQSLSDSKLKSQHMTFEKVLEQYLMKIRLNEQLFNEDLQRDCILNSVYGPVNLNSKKKLKDQKESLDKLKIMKELLRQKVNNFQKIFNKLTQISDIKDPRDLNIVILRLNRREELQKSRIKLEEKLCHLEDMKKTLVSKLEYMKKQDLEFRFFNINERIESLALQQKSAERKLENFYNLTAEQEITLTTCLAVSKKCGYPLKLKRETKIHEIQEF